MGLKLFGIGHAAMDGDKDMAELKGIYILWYRELLRLRRDRPRLIASLGTPILYLIVFGFGLSRLMGTLAPGLNFTQFLFPGLLGMTVLMAALMSGMSVVWEREMGFLKEVLVAPLSRRAMVFGKAFGGATLAMLQGLILLVLAPLLGISLSLTSLLWLLPFLLLIAFALSSLGVLIASRTYTMEGFQVVLNLVLLPLIFLSGIFFPLTGLPGWLDVIVKINPITYGVEAIRHLILGPVVPSVAWFGRPVTLIEDTLVIVALAVIVTGLAIWSLSRQE